jgi:hypothetical protein
MSDFVVPTLIVVAALAAAVFLRFRWGKTALPAVPVSPEVVAPSWDEDAALREAVDATPELRALYGRLGYLPEVEREAERIVGEIKGLVRAEIPDFAAFGAALAEVEAQLGAGSTEDSERPRFRRENEALLRAVLAVRGDEEAVLRLLNEDPVDQLLPLVEQIPMVRNGEVIWRTPMELTLVRKRPSNPARFERLLDELDWLVRSARLRRRPTAREAALAAIVRLRRDAARENAYLPTPVQALVAEVDGWLHHSLEPVVRRRREELDGLLRGLLRLRQDLETGGGDLRDFRETSRAQAQLYAGQPWMQVPWLTTFALANLLDTELALLPAKERAQPTSPAGVLRLVRDEVASRHYDSDETIRRLRQQEERGLFVHSLVYALLRMNRLPAAAPDDSGAAGRADAIV